MAKSGYSWIRDPLINRSIEVGVFSVPIDVANPRTGASAEMMALVDTGSALPVLPRSVLRDLGIEVAQRRIFEYADGRREELDVGRADIGIEGQMAPTFVVFGSDDVEPILGAVVFELLGITINPANKRLIPANGLIY